jgi:hypothetical protein
MAAKSKPVQGQIFSASPEGFAALLAKANEVHEDGLVLVSVVPIGTGKLGALFVRIPRGMSAALIGE